MKLRCHHHCPCQCHAPSEGCTSTTRMAESTEGISSKARRQHTHENCCRSLRPLVWHDGCHTKGRGTGSVRRLRQALPAHTPDELAPVVDIAAEKKAVGPWRAQGRDCGQSHLLSLCRIGGLPSTPAGTTLNSRHQKY